MHRKLVVGVISLLVVAILNPDFPSWLMDTVFGITLATLFLMPLARILTGERRCVSYVFMVVGVLVFSQYVHIYLNDDLVAGIVFLCEWLATFAFISVVFQLIFAEIREELFERLSR